MKMTDISTLARLLSYDPHTGIMLWLPRTIADCSGGQEMRRWNTRYAGQEAFRVNSQGYRSGMVFRTMHRAHRIAWAMVHGCWPATDIDHINGDRADNRIANLREVSRSINCRNQKLRSTNKTGVTGVYPHKGRWRATICVGRVRHLGVFDTFEDAVSARKQAEQENDFHKNHGRPRKVRGGIEWSKPE